MPWGLDALTGDAKADPGWMEGASPSIVKLLAPLELPALLQVARAAAMSASCTVTADFLSSST